MSKKIKKTGGSMKKRSFFNYRSIIKVSLFALMVMVLGQLQATYVYHNENITCNQTWEYWDYENNEAITHCVSAHISVSAGIWLTIQERCVVRIENYSSLTIYGALTTYGTETYPIVFHNFGSGITLSNTTNNCSLTHLNLNECGVTVNNCTRDITVTNCNFSDASLTVDNGSSPEISLCEFNNGGITVNHNSTPNIWDTNGCWIHVNNDSTPHIWNISDSTIRVENGAAPEINDCNFNNSVGSRFYGCGSAVLTNCSFNNSTDRGIHINGADNLEFSNCTFNSNASNGIEVEGDVMVTFTSCNADSNGTYGVYNFGDYFTAVIFDNTHIRENVGDGIYATGGNFTFTNSLIYSNGGCGMKLLDEDIYITITDCLSIASNGSAGININANIVGDLPEDSFFSIGDNNPDAVCVNGGTVTVSTSWLERNNHYQILGDVTVGENSTLQLPTDSNLYFSENGGLEIYGTIVADSVSFEPILTGNWKGIAFHYNEPGSILNACEIKYAGFRDDTYNRGPASIIIYCEDSDSTVTITNCDISNGNEHGIFIEQSNPLIENCTITNCSGNGIYIHRSDPIIINNTISLSDSCGIYLGTSSEPYIDNCNIYSNGEYGVFAYGTSHSGTLKNGSIWSNTGPSTRIPVEMVRDITTINIYGNQNNHQIEISGGHMNIDAVWYNTYDYILYGSPFLGEGALTLEAGTILKFDTNKDMDIRTSLTAIGTPENHIVFTSNQPTPAPGDWDKLYFDYCGETSQLAYCDIQYGGSEGWGSVVLWEHTANFDHCDISHSNSSGMGFWGDATAYITNSEIHHNATFGVESNPWNSVAHISDTAIHNNGDYAVQTGADEVKYITDDINIYNNEIDAIKVLGDDVITGSWQYHNVPYDIEGDINVLNNETLTIAAGNDIRFTGAYSIIVEGTLIAVGDPIFTIDFTDFPETRTSWKNIHFSLPDGICNLTYCNFSFGGSNANGMLEFDNVGNLQMSHCLVENSITNGLYISDNSSLSLTDCLISDNLDNGIYHTNNSSSEFTNCNFVVNENAGIYFTNNSSSELINCTIKDNILYGINIDINDGSLPTFGSSLNEWNDIYNNGLFDFANGTSDIEAEYIYWGTTDIDEINAVIHDENDDATLGLVNIISWTDIGHNNVYTAGIEAPQNVTISIVGAEVQISWSAVDGATSYKVYSDTNPYGTFSNLEQSEITETEWSESVSGEMKFYYVTADN